MILSAQDDQVAQLDRIVFISSCSMSRSRQHDRKATRGRKLGKGDQHDRRKGTE